MSILANRRCRIANVCMTFEASCAEQLLTHRLAEQSRPTTLEGYVGQSDLVGQGSLLRARIEAGEGVGSCILWGPPGSGKT